MIKPTGRLASIDSPNKIYALYNSVNRSHAVTAAEGIVRTALER